jgi:hypothetical protein
VGLLLGTNPTAESPGPDIERDNNDNNDNCALSQKKTRPVLSASPVYWNPRADDSRAGWTRWWRGEAIGGAIYTRSFDERQ